MLTKFWETVGSKAAEQWVARALTPAFVFWAGGLIAVVTSTATSVADQVRVVTGLGVVVQVALLVGALLGLAASAVVAERLTDPVLQLLSGYWPGGWPRSALVRRHVAARARLRAELAVLTERRDRGGLTDAEYRELNALRSTPHRRSTVTRRAELEERRASVHPSAPDVLRTAVLRERLRELPATPELTMPTRLGNVLRGGEERPRLKYGLDVVACWPHLWLTLDKETRDELARARADLDNRVRTWLWAVLFLVWTWWAWWAPVVAVAVAVPAYYLAVVGAARVQVSLVEAAFDLYRTRLYTALRFPLPSVPLEEPTNGRRLTGYLWHGPDGSETDFTP